MTVAPYFILLAVAYVNSAVYPTIPTRKNQVQKKVLIFFLWVWHTIKQMVLGITFRDTR